MAKMFLTLHVWMTVNLFLTVVSGCGSTRKCRMPPNWIIRRDSCWRENTVSTICYLYTHPDYESLANISHDITSLEICVDQFIADRLNLDHITHLKELSFYPLQKNNISHFAVSNNSTKHQLASLEKLDIHIHLNGIDTTLFENLTQLRTLDLSEVQALPVDDIKRVLQALHSAGAPLEKLYLHSSHNQTSKSDILKLTDILMNVRGFPLKVLDLRRITNLEIGIGFAQFTQGLEKLCFGWHRNIIMSDWDESCVWLDISILKELAYLHFELGPWPGIQQAIACSEPWADVKLLKKIISHDKTLSNCYKFAEDNCSCQCFARINNDQLLIDYASSLKYTQVNATVFPPFPVGQNLKRLRISGTQMQAKEGNVKIIQHDSALTYLEYLNYNLPSDPPLVSLANAQSGLTKLTYLDLRNSIGDIVSASSIWKSTPHLDALHLWFNKYTESHSGVDIFSAIPNLRTLDLRYCTASSLPDVSSLTKLKKINLKFNELTHLSKHFTSILDNLTVNNITVDLFGNPLSCHCQDQWFVSWMKNTKVHFDNSDKLKCEYPGNRYSVNPLEIDLVGLSIRCSNFRHILTAVLLTLASMCIMLIVILIIRKRWRIRYWLHAARTSWNQTQSSNANFRHRYLYDAFVAYCSRDEEERRWVHLTLVPKLEQEYGFKLCVHHRDFTPGYDIADNIVESIDTSNKVLLILSPSFLESDWCQFEVRMAQVKLIQDKRDSLVLVIYKRLDVPRVRLPRKLIRILEKKTYAEWTTDSAGQNLFWGKLNRALKEEIRHEPYNVFARGVRSADDDRDQELQPLLG